MDKSKPNWSAYLSISVLLVAMFFLVQYLINAQLLDVYYQINLFMMGINIILAVSLNLITGFTGQLSLGHAGFMAVGAYVAAVMTTKLGYSLPVAVLSGCIAAGVAGVLIGVPTLRLKGDYLAIATLGFGEIVRVVLLNIDYVGGAAGLIGIAQLTNWTWLFFSVLVTLLFIQNLINSSYGRACLAVRENEVAAEMMGVDTTKYKILAFTVGAFFAGLAGALYAHYFFIIQPGTFSFFRSFDVLVMVVLGGLGSTTGAVLAAVFLTILSAGLQSFPEIRMVIYSVVLIVTMIYRPQGLMGNKEISLRIFRRVRGEDRGATRSEEPL
ncbi:MAG TPA: branched-chain amino acid ABC transporter permease [Syntrophothermus lipocalidus]|nr:branched-chain amino acid ABC transporter permease [Syntrophothermus lipocalidus]